MSEDAGQFIPGFKRPSDCQNGVLLFVSEANNLLVRCDGDRVVLPSIDCLDGIDLDGADYFGALRGSHCFCVNFEEGMHIPDGFSFRNLRELLTLMDKDTCRATLRAVHISYWMKNSRYCGVCGNRTERSSVERAMICSVCGNTIYPRIAPAVIIAIVKDDKLLLAHNRGLPNNRYSIIAGFMEPGETFEETARREVMEEVGLSITNIRYFDSQPWPFPDSLMIGLTAEYAGGEIAPDGEEIERAGWFGADELPDIPGTVSIAGRLIEWFTRKHLP